MCGIVGYIGSKSAASVIIDGLKRLEYRGYDSAGIAVIDNNTIKTCRGAGKISILEKAISNSKKNFANGTLAIGHTRWATHGKPSEENAHPHSSCNNEVVVVHNGIIENFIELKKELTKEGHIFKSETDTEVIAHILESNLKNYPSESLLGCLIKTINVLRGAYAIAAISTKEPDKLVVARKDAPLIIGLGEGENFAASDIPAILPYTRKVIFMEDGDVAEIKRESVRIFSISKKENGSTYVEVKRKVMSINWDAVQAEKGGYKHFMLKEIFEQPQAVQDTFRGRLFPEEGKVFLEDEIPFTEEKINSIERIYIIACGTSYHAGLVGKYLFEKYLKIPVEVDIASEFRYRYPVLDEKTLAIFITQSGETADTLASLRLAKNSGATTLTIANVVGSTASREAHATLFTRCGPEIGVASTKAFTGQLTTLYLLLLDWGSKRKSIPDDILSKMAISLWDLPVKISDILKNTAPQIENLARKFFHSKDFLYLGRNINYPIALEGALKLKEISYIHAEGYAAGEMKHGPIALIDENMPVMVIATKSEVKEKIISNIEEVSARLGTVIALVSDDDDMQSARIDYAIKLPTVDEFVSPVINVIPLQLFAYYCAVLKGNDVDQPRNLAKSVTVE